MPVLTSSDLPDLGVSGLKGRTFRAGGSGDAPLAALKGVLDIEVRIWIGSTIESLAHQADPPCIVALH